VSYVVSQALTCSPQQEVVVGKHEVVNVSEYIHV
jgi:hypothetical protein